MMPSSDQRTEIFESHRDLLRAAAYRMLGSAGDAEDMVQETWLRWTKAEAVASPKNWLLKVLNRLCLDRLKSARVQRERYFGTWLPEPFLETAAPSRPEEVDETVSIALMLVLEKLSPAERAGFLLHDVFDFTFGEIADVLNKPEPSCRKLVSRARARVRAEKPRFAATTAEHEELMKRFLDACREGEIEPLLALFDNSAALYSDGGGKASAVPNVLAGPEAIARFFIRIIRNLEAKDHEFRPASFNGAPGVLFLVEGVIVTALSLEIRQGRIRAIFGHRNPDKLRAFTARHP